MNSWVIALSAVGIAYFAHTAKTFRAQWYSLARIIVFMFVWGLSLDSKDLRYLAMLAATAICSVAGLGLIQYIRGR
jgi:hypothetical protein